MSGVPEEAERGLTLAELAETAGLDLPTAYEYCGTFEEHLVYARPRRWAPITAALLQLIHMYYGAGYTTAEIHREFKKAELTGAVEHVRGPSHEPNSDRAMLPKAEWWNRWRR